MTSLDDASPMKRPKCTPENSILESDLELAAKHGIIDRIEINETRHGFYVTVTFADPDNTLEKHPEKGLQPWFHVLVQLLAIKDKRWYLTSRRDRHSPRLHKRLDLLNDVLREKYPTDSVVLLRNQELPGTPRVRGPKRVVRSS